MNSTWESVARDPHPSAYLDPLVARQKREAHLQLVRRWLRGLNPQSVLKTDLFEEAFGEDRVLLDLAPNARHTVGIDIAATTVIAARRHCSAAGFSFLVSDVRALALRTDSFELVFSNSTLDHFETRAELLAALRELVRVVRPSGLLIITLDNPWNPLYPLLRWATRLRQAPYVLGYTASRQQLNGWLNDLGMEVVENGWLIHNPRLLSTGLFLGLRKIMGRAADGPIRTLLRLFEFLGRLPAAPFTACFSAVCARKPAR
ncbi:MAG: class I SAM-dependent methyltransferase [Bryobacteraceae bacterium]|jgi:ubiquinone/menaquinone biosynthesis C-methylase UbiE